MHTRVSRLAASARGASLIEFAVTLPVLVLLLFGVMQFGLAYNHQLILTDAVRAGARQLSISRGVSGDICSTAGTKVRNAAITLTQAQITMTMRVNGTNYTAAAGALPACSAAGLSMTIGADATMTATYPCSFRILGVTFGPSPCNIGGTTTARVE